jgi:preprotein translocase subunit SecG
LGRTVATVAFIIVCLALIVVVLMQEGKDAGFGGTLSGQVDSYVKKNRGRTREGMLERTTVILGVLYFLLAIGLSLKFFL